MCVLLERLGNHLFRLTRNSLKVANFQGCIIPWQNLRISITQSWYSTRIPGVAIYAWYKMSKIKKKYIPPEHTAIIYHAHKGQNEQIKKQIRLPDTEIHDKNNQHLHYTVRVFISKNP